MKPFHDSLSPSSPTAMAATRNKGTDWGRKTGGNDGDDEVGSTEVTGWEQMQKLKEARDGPDFP
ncbi:hypothetical protein DVH24_005352 [Malus domestica]|uniref:Uncharacterized protein n=1 Tax=Malus domestica TaxID=3750 RepID=A0A498KHD9_MALDO|nr:hypothetical protein DVH24_005352 [Malus domestica]